MQTWTMTAQDIFNLCSSSNTAWPGSVARSDVNVEQGMPPSLEPAIVVLLT